MSTGARLVQRASSRPRAREKDILRPCLFKKGRKGGIEGEWKGRRRGKGREGEEGKEERRGEAEGGREGEGGKLSDLSAED